jgi:hypothetical protein
MFVELPHQIGSRQPRGLAAQVPDDVDERAQRVGGACRQLLQQADRFGGP